MNGCANQDGGVYNMACVYTIRYTFYIIWEGRAYNVIGFDKRTHELVCKAVLGRLQYGMHVHDSACDAIKSGMGPYATWKDSARKCMRGCSKQDARGKITVCIYRIRYRVLWSLGWARIQCHRIRLGNA